MKQNEAKKLGIKYDAKRNWDHLKGQGTKSESDDGKELKEENVTEGDGSRKRTRYEFNDDYDEDEGPPNKKQRVSENHDDSLSDSSNSSLAHKKPIRRHSLESSSKKKVKRRRLSAN